MSRMFRSAAATLLLFLLACRSLPALPLVAWTLPAETQGGKILTAVAEWIESIFSIMDPDGNH